jgi:Ca2+-dependent lipid-binding protein
MHSLNFENGMIHSYFQPLIFNILTLRINIISILKIYTSHHIGLLFIDIKQTLQVNGDHHIGSSNSTELISQW